jgi:hypothetical protein
VTAPIEARAEPDRDMGNLLRGPLTRSGTGQCRTNLAGKPHGGTSTASSVQPSVETV